MKRISVLGVNYKKTPVDVREKLYFTADELPRLLKALSGIESLSEVMVLSTCNRTEAIFVSEEPVTASAGIIKELAARKKMPCETIKNGFYRFSGGEAVLHVFKVASGLDSMVLGENEVTGQFKGAYDLALKHRATGKALLTLYQAAMAAVKKIKARTGVSRGTVSVSRCAVGLAERALKGLSGKRVLVVGAGDMANSAAAGFINKGVRSVDVINKTYSKAVEMAGKYNGTAYGFGMLNKAVENADIILCSTASHDPVVKAEMVKNAISKRPGRELFIFDIAVPRDVEAGVEGIKNVHLYNIDDLKTMTADTVSARKNELVKAESILKECAAAFEAELYMREKAVLVNAIREQIYKTVAEECAFTALKNGLGEEEKASLRATTMAVVNRVISAHMGELKKQVERGGAKKEGLVDMVKKAFKIYE
jgi:glutamyl-tRNA reductase